MTSYALQLEDKLFKDWVTIDCDPELSKIERMFNSYIEGDENHKLRILICEYTELYSSEETPEMRKVKQAEFRAALSKEKANA